MAILEINWQPNLKQLRSFGLLLLGATGAAPFIYTMF